MRTMIIVLLIISAAGRCSAQEIAGHIFNEQKQELVNAVVLVYQNGILKGENVSDLDGNYIIRSLSAGGYDVVILHRGYDPIKMTNVIVTAENRTVLNESMYVKPHPQVAVIKYKRPPVVIDRSGITVLTREQIEDLPTQKKDATYYCHVLYPQRRGWDVNIPGIRGTLYLIEPYCGLLIPQQRSLPISMVPFPANPSSHVFTHADVDLMPWTSIRDVASTVPGVYQMRRGDDVSVFGDRIGGSHYIVDGMR